MKPYNSIFPYLKLCLYRHLYLTFCEHITVLHIDEILFMLYHLYKVFNPPLSRLIFICIFKTSWTLPLLRILLRRIFSSFLTLIRNAASVLIFYAYKGFTIYTSQYLITVWQSLSPLDYRCLEAREYMSFHFCVPRL